MNIKIRTFFTLITMFLIVLIILLVKNINELTATTNEQKDFEHNRHLMVMKSDELRQSSDDLSRFANKYVITSKIKYKENYFTTLDIRNGKVKRPKNYDGIYWNLSKEKREKRHPLTISISLKDEMKNLPYTKYEFEKLQESEKNSNDLVNLEVEAFNAMIGLFKDSNGTYSIKKAPNQQLAISLMNSDAYDLAKEKIMLPIDDFLESLKERTTQSIAMYNKKTDELFITIYIILGFGFLLFSIVAFLIHKKVLYPIDWLTNTILNFQKGAKDLNEIVFYNDEIGLMTKQFFAMKKKLDDDYEAIKLLSLTDPLTKIGNRRAFFEISEQLLKSAKRDKEEISLMILDIDFFKKVNDTYGHIIGDEILKFLVKNIKMKLRGSDILGRFGGEEFIILLPKTNIDGAKTVAQGIRKHIENSTYIDEKYSINITVSIGVTHLNESDTLLRTIVQRADEALYRAKENGRNRVEVIN